MGAISLPSGTNACIAYWDNFTSKLAKFELLKNELKNNRIISQIEKQILDLSCKRKPTKSRRKLWVSIMFRYFLNRLILRVISFPTV
jgi:hypothetical protein